MVNSDFTIDITDDLQKYDELVPEILANDLKKLKSVSNKVLPFVFQEILKNTLVVKDAKGKNRERFLDLLMLNYTRLGKASLEVAKESFMKDIVNLKANFTEMMKLIPQKDTTSASRIDGILKNSDLLNSSLRESNETLAQKELNARLALTKTIDSSNTNNSALIDRAIVEAYNRAVAENIIDLETANLEKKLIFTTPSIVTDEEKVKKTESANKTATVASDTTNEPGATTDLSKKTNILPESKEQKAEPIDVEPVGPTEPYTPPGVDVDVKKAEEKAFQNSMHEPSTKILGIDSWKFIAIVFAIVMVIISIFSFFYLRTTAEVNYDSKEEKNLSETKKPKDGNK